MLYLQFAFLLIMLYMGSRYGGIGPLVTWFMTFLLGTGHADRRRLAVAAEDAPRRRFALGCHAGDIFV